MKHWIWDFDGTLFDSYSRMNDALLKALAEQGVHPSPEEALGYLKISVRSSIRHYAGLHGFDPTPVLERYMWHELNSSAPLLPYPGMKALCEAHCAQGGKHYLYTHRDGSALEALGQQGMASLFVDAVTSEDKFPHKPAPDALLHLIAKHGLEPSEALMLGDRDIDIQAAENAGIAGCLFDPEHFFDGFETALRADTVEGLGQLLLQH